MKYSPQQLQDINRYYETINREIALAKLKNRAYQTILIDKQIDANLLDKRNAGDIENDKFARRSLVNDYSNELITSGNVYEFQKKVMDEGYDEFFLNNYPKIKQEAKMYRVQNPANMYGLIQRLYNKTKQELKFIDDKKISIKNDDDIINLLQQISLNLSGSIGMATSPASKRQYEDSKLKIDGLTAGLNMVGNKIQFLQDAFGESYDDIKKGLSVMAQSTTIPTTPNIPLNPPPVTELQNISPITIQQAVDNQTQGNLKKAPNATNNLNLDLTTYNDQDYKNLKDLVSDDSITRKDFAKILVDLSDNYITANQLDYNKNATKEEMWNIFSKNRSQRIP